MTPQEAQQHALTYITDTLHRLVFERQVAFPIDYFPQLSEDELKQVEDAIEAFVDDTLKQAGLKRTGLKD